MTLQLVQAGTGAARPLIVAAGPFVASKLRADLGARPCIVYEDDPHGSDPMGAIVDFAARRAHLESVSDVAFVAFSAGCMRVRALRRAGARAGAYLLTDGTHANLPPLPGQIEWLAELADEARAGRILLVTTHTLQTYTEQLRPPQAPFMASVNVLRKSTRFPLADAGPWDRPTLSRDPQTGPPERGLYVYSYATAEADYPGHVYQGGPALHTLARAHLRPWLGLAPEPMPHTIASSSSTSTTNTGAGLGFGAIAAAAFLASH